MNFKGVVTAVKNAELYSNVGTFKDCDLIEITQKELYEESQKKKYKIFSIIRYSALALFVLSFVSSLIFPITPKYYFPLIVFSVVITVSFSILAVPRIKNSWGKIEMPTQKPHLFKRGDEVNALIEVNYG